MLKIAKTVEIWTANLDVLSEHYDKNLALLSDDEFARAKRFYATVHQKRFVSARAALRQLLQNYLQIAAQEIIFSYPNNKPGLHYPKTRLKFNLSHSNEHAIFVFMNNVEVGIDIEKIRNVPYLAIAKRCFSADEIKLLQQTKSQQKEMFFRIWSRKEAVIKAAGIANKLSPRQINVPCQPEGGVAKVNNQQWFIMAIDAIPGYDAALASNKKVDSIIVKRFLNAF